MAGTSPAMTKNKGSTKANVIGRVFLQAAVRL
jgi:hypothetical protein